jgi:hypothetical protein
LLAEASRRVERTSDDKTTIPRPHFARLPPPVKDAVGVVGEFDRRAAWIDEEVNPPCRLTGAHHGPVGMERLENAFVRC